MFYRDHGDDYVTQHAPLSGAITPTLSFLADQTANGGGDYPEAVEEGLSVAIESLGGPSILLRGCYFWC